MRVVRGFGGLPAKPGPTIVAMGNFDGVHRGHQAILQSVRVAARARGVEACVATFFPHPLTVLAPDRAPPMVQTLEDRIQTLDDHGGVDLLLVVPFTEALAQVEAEVFLREFLVGRLGCVHLFVGEDARFGRDRAGDVAMLRRWAGEESRELTVVGPVTWEGVRVSSSGIRRLIVAGDVKGAAALLGRPFSMVGEVVRGAGRGRGIGFPTANLVPDGETRPADGVYASVAVVGARRFPAAVHLGPVPTFGATLAVVEAHLVGFDGDLLGQRVRLHFLDRLRGIERFADVEALKTAISADAARTVEIAAAAASLAPRPPR